MIVITGAPELGLSGLATSIADRLCEHLTVLPNAAKIVAQAGFSMESPHCLAAAQRAIYHLRRELEQSALDDGRYTTVLCEGGSLDGLVHWPLEPRRFFSELGTTRKAELARYAAVVHVRRATGRAARGAAYADRDADRALDTRISAAWSGHARLHVVDAAADMLEGFARADLSRA